MTIKLTGTLEIDPERGVIYFHLNNVGDIKRIGGQITLLRICQLPTPIPSNTFLDITHMHGVSWGILEARE
jgi:hypothetical protein